MKDLPITGLRPSEAIRKGCEMVPRQAVCIYHPSRLGGAEGACVLGAMELGVMGSSLLEEWRQDFERSHGAIMRLTQIWKIPQPLLEQAIKHNDHNHWTREAIADWLEEQGW